MTSLKSILLLFLVILFDSALRKDYFKVFLSGIKKVFLQILKKRILQVFFFVLFLYKNRKELKKCSFFQNKMKNSFVCPLGNSTQLPKYILSNFKTINFPSNIFLKAPAFHINNMFKILFY